MELTRTSMFTGVTRTRVLPITEAQVLEYLKGKKVQDAFPHLSMADREWIMTGVTDEEWHQEFQDLVS